MDTDKWKSFVPGFFMGLSRAAVSHPFEILKIRSQLGVYQKASIFRGIQYSLLASGVERGIQFGLYETFRKNDSNLVSSIKSSWLSTLIGIPYNFFIVNKYGLGKDPQFTVQQLKKTVPLEYMRTFSASTIFLFTYNNLKEREYPLWLSAFGGTTAVWLTTYPLDNVRNQIIRSDGFQPRRLPIRDLYRGVSYPIMRSIPSSIVGMYVYERVKLTLGNRDCS